MTSKLKKEIARMNELIAKLKEWKSLEQAEVEATLKELEKIPRNEWSKFKVDALSDPKLARALVSVGNTFSENWKILRNAVSTLHSLISRYELTATHEIHEFLLRHRGNKKVAYYIALVLPYLPQFENNVEQWEYIMKIPTFAPHDKSADIFYGLIWKRAGEIPEERQEEIIGYFRNLLSNESLGEYRKKKCRELLARIDEARPAPSPTTRPASRSGSRILA